MGEKVFVGNLNFETTAGEVEALFAQAGEVVGVSLPTDRMTGRPRGFAFVEFANPEDAAAAIPRFSGQENFIGTDINGASPIPNAGDGVLLLNSTENNTVGGNPASPGVPPGNVISGNGRDGIRITGSATTGHQVRGNLIGTAAAGSAALANAGNGVTVEGSPSNTIGGSTSSARNIISGNSGSLSFGVDISGAGASGNIIAGNYIGTSASGADPLGNGAGGVRITAATASAASNIVGGSSAAPGARCHSRCS